MKDGECNFNLIFLIKGFGELALTSNKHRAATVVT